MKPLQRCFVFSTFEMRNYCIALILNRTLLMLVFIIDCQRSVEMSRGKKRNNGSQRRIGVFAPVLPDNKNKHAFYYPV